MDGNDETATGILNLECTSIVNPRNPEKTNTILPPSEADMSTE
jgi:hypothetical protein